MGAGETERERPLRPLARTGDRDLEGDLEAGGVSEPRLTFLLLRLRPRAGGGGDLIKKRYVLK